MPTLTDQQITDAMNNAAGLAAMAAPEYREVGFEVIFRFKLDEALEALLQEGE